ncbi:S8 family serine peptidase [Myroides injenensis]|uniref:S8 family serine peptidase n=1 Tax=Myroides injenensis TaxID=1183151 RepID=UPI000288EE7F|nr:S8 family serine peptidase [Myroides injenensis]
MRKFIISFLFICISVSSFGQRHVVRKDISSQYNKEEVDKLNNRFIKEEILNQKNISTFLKTNNIKPFGIYNDGRTYKLRRIDSEGLPIYYSTFNAITRKVLEVDAISYGENLLDLRGKDMIIGVWDGAVALDTHIEFVEKSGKSKVVLKDRVQSLNSLNNIEQEEYESSRNHATHVIGTITAIGENSFSQGMAPLSTVWSYDWDNDIQELVRAASQGILVTNHSYGISALSDDLQPLLPSSYFGYYNIDAHNFDKIAYQFPYLQSVVAAGNDRNYYDILNKEKKGNELLLGFANAKNVIVVAAANMAIDEYPSVASFSSFGPSNDFRIKPDITARGVNIVSTGYENPYLVNDRPSNEIYTRLSGTSMASPAVAGILSLWQEWVIENKNFPLRAASLKAVMIQSANYLKDNMPSHETGWGMINAKNGVHLLQNIADGNALLDESTLFDGSIYKREIEVVDEGQGLMVTLSWTDPEKENKGLISYNNQIDYSLVNDLDLRVYKNGIEYLPWYLNKDFDNLHAKKGDNNTDNIEKIDIPDAEIGKYEIVISHKNSLKYGKQDFSLLASNFNFQGVKSKSIEPIIKEKKVDFWPNPVVDYLNIEIGKENIFSNNHIYIYDLSNRLVGEYRVFGTNRTMINLSHLPSGIYLLNLEVSGEQFRYKVLKR